MKGYARAPAYEIIEVVLADVAHLFDEHHAYKSTGKVCVYSWAVVEDGAPVAAFLWQPPPPGAARSVAPTCPQGVLALSRMVAVPRERRRLKHISKPLRYQMQHLIDRTRWPVLVTYSDEGAGHNGYTYQCSGWKATVRNRARTQTVDGRRVSRYSNGANVHHADAVDGWTWIQRWEHWITPVPGTLFAMHWRRVPTGRTWRSGAPAYRYERIEA
jgi:hypothetical protein